MESGTLVRVPLIQDIYTSDGRWTRQKVFDETIGTQLPEFSNMKIYMRSNELLRLPHNKLQLEGLVVSSSQASATVLLSSLVRSNLKDHEFKWLRIGADSDANLVASSGNSRSSYLQYCTARYVEEPKTRRV